MREVERIQTDIIEADEQTNLVPAGLNVEETATPTDSITREIPNVPLNVSESFKGSYIGGTLACSMYRSIGQLENQRLK